MWKEVPWKQKKEVLSCHLISSSHISHSRQSVKKSLCLQVTLCYKFAYKPGTHVSAVTLPYVYSLKASSFSTKGVPMGSGDVVTQQWQKPCLLLNFNLNAVKIIFIFKNLV